MADPISTTSTPITFTGLGSGIDFQSIITKLVDAEKYNINRMNTWKTDWQNKITALQTLNTKLAALGTKAQSMDTLAEFLVRTASTSDETIMTASASSSASVGTHAVIVNQLAQAEKELQTNGEASDTTIVNNTGSSKTFKYQYASGSIITVNVPDQTTLSGLKDLINNDSNNPGITASILNTGTGATPYHLVLTGKDMGATKTIVIDPTSDATLTGYTNGTFTKTQTASNAQIRVDGYPSGPPWIERTTNTITDVIDGVTLNLLSADPSTPVSVTIGSDTSQVKQKIEDFVTAFNDVQTNIHDLTYYDAKTGKHGLLIGNYAVMMVQSRINNIVSGSAPGFKDGAQTYINLAQIGIKTDANEASTTHGQMIIDEAALDSALQNNLDAVGKLFSANFEGYSDNTSNATYQSYISGITKPGWYTLKYTISGGNITSALIKLHDEPDSSYRDASYENTDKTITGSSSYPESGLVAKAIKTSDGTYTADIRLLQGISGALTSELSDLNNPNTGLINVLDGSYNDIINNIDKNITQEQQRVDTVQQRLQDQFSRLEAALTTLNNQSTALQSQIAQLSPNIYY